MAESVGTGEESADALDVGVRAGQGLRMTLSVLASGATYWLYNWAGGAISGSAPRPRTRPSS